jgi:glycosyltransferase involved in cell wall biosynthesis
VAIPCVSVVMAVYNGEQYLHEAVESILHQTFSNFEFIIVDDGSTDESPETLARYAACDSRIILVSNKENMGLARSLNKGLKLTHGKYIARMDVDDISLPDRLARQVEFMEAHSHIGICGTWMQTFGQERYDWRPPQDDAEIRSHLFFDSVLAHPSVMMRREVMVAHQLRYNAEYKASQDYALWAEAAEFTSFANLPKVLLRYRTHERQVSSAGRTKQIAYTDRVRLRQLARLGVNVTDREKELHLKVAKLDVSTTSEIIKADAWLQRLQLANQRLEAFPEPAFSERLALQWFYLCRAAVTRNIASWHSFWRSPLSNFAEIKCLSKIKFFLLYLYAWIRNFPRHFRKQS